MNKMEKKDILELISAFKESELGVLEIKDSEFSFRLEAQQVAQPQAVQIPAVLPAMTDFGVSCAGGAVGTGGTASIARTACTDGAACNSGSIATGSIDGAIANAESTASAREADSACLEQVKAPLVGVFYAAPSPEAEPYVTEGMRVQKGQVLCLLEAMKMMNELKSPVEGVVRAIKGINGELAEYGQVLFEVEKC